MWQLWVSGVDENLLFIWNKKQILREFCEIEKKCREIWRVKLCNRSREIALPKFFFHFTTGKKRSTRLERENFVSYFSVSFVQFSVHQIGGKSSSGSEKNLHGKIKYSRKIDNWDIKRTWSGSTNFPETDVCVWVPRANIYTEFMKLRQKASALKSPERDPVLQSIFVDKNVKISDAQAKISIN